MSHDFDFYKGIVRELTADEAGKRFPDQTIRAGLRLALNDYQRYFPRTRSEDVAATLVGENLLKLHAVFPPGDSLIGIRFPEPNTEIVAIDRDKVVFSDGQTCLRLSPMLQFMLKYTNGSKLRLILSTPHTIAALEDGITETSIPVLHAVTIAKGATAYALRIRANAVTEIHGKRIEEINALRQEAKTLFNEFRIELAERGICEKGLYEPLPSGVPFPI